MRKSGLPTSFRYVDSDTGSDSSEIDSDLDQWVEISEAIDPAGCSWHGANESLDPRSPKRYHRAISEGLRFICDFCGKMFATRKSIHSHMKIHSGR